MHLKNQHKFIEHQWSSSVEECLPNMHKALGSTLIRGKSATLELTPATMNKRQEEKDLRGQLRKHILVWGGGRER